MLAKLPKFLMESLKPLTLDSEIDDNNLSLGQKQLICLGRVLLERRKILLVDEGTSNIDEGLEEKIREVLESLEGVTIIAIAHRLRDPEKDSDVT
jgi:ABC-type multidrug transport system fused ATPase/permease subunit